MVWAINVVDTIKHTYYNVWDFSFGDFVLDDPLLVSDAAVSAEPVQVTHPDGICFPAFQEIVITGTPMKPRVAIDFLAGAGAFTTGGPSTAGFAGHIGAPKIARSADNALHLVSKKLSALGAPRPIYYSRGIPVIEMGFGFEIVWQVVDGANQLRFLDSTITFGHTVAASPTGERVAILYTRHPDLSLASDQPDNNDVFLCMSENGGDSFSEPLNITQFIQPDVDACCASIDFSCCNRDTLRAFDHISALFDDENVLHVAYTTIGYYHMPSNGANSTRRDRAMLWHWDELTESHHLIAEHWITNVDSLTVLPGLANGRAILEHPTLAYDPSTDYLYCAYLKYDTAAHLNGASLINADVFLSRSTDSGADWSIGTNITSTTPNDNENRNEQELSAAPNILSSELTCEYVLHKAPSYDVNDTPFADVCLSFVNVDDITYGPNIAQRPLHVEVVECDTIEISGTIDIVSATTGLCDSVQVTYVVHDPGNATEIQVFRNTVIVDLLPVIVGDTLIWTDYSPATELSTYWMTGWSTICGEVAVSNTAIGYAAHRPEVIHDFEATDDRCDAVYMTWTPASPLDSVLHYTLFRGDDHLADVSPEMTEFVDSSATPNSAHEYWISGVNRCGDSDMTSALGVLLAPNNGTAILSLVNSGPPDWDYRLILDQGCVSQLVIRDLCPGTTASFVGTANWTAQTLGDSALFLGEPIDLFAGSVDGFRLTNTNPDCIGDGSWSAGNSGGRISGPLPVDDTAPLPTEFSVSVFPNPFNPTTTFSLALPQAAIASLHIYNIAGQLVHEASLGYLPRGNHTIPFTADDLPSGMYVAKLNAGSYTSTHKLLLLK